MQFVVPDYIGTNTISLHNKSGSPISNKLEVVIAPSMMDYDNFKQLRDDHIPDLVKNSGADEPPEGMYPGGTSSIEEEKILLNIEKLLEFSSKLLKVTNDIKKGAYTYKVEVQRKTMKSQIRGAVRWQKTALARAQKGTEYATAHVTDIRKRKWSTPTNILLVKFHMEVFIEAIFFRDEMDRREREKKAWATIYGKEYQPLDDSTKEQLDKLDLACKFHKGVLGDGKLAELIPKAKDTRKEERLINREAIIEAKTWSRNRAYRELPELWREFLDEYQSYYEETVLVETQKMTDIYALWILCEMASGLKLSAHAKSLREFRSKNKDIVIKYDAPEQVRQGWSNSIMGSLFGDSDTKSNPIQGSGQPEIFMNYRGVNFYFEAKYNLRETPREEDVYKVLAYMNNYDVSCGGIIYPGPQLKITVDKKNKQVMAWIPFTWTEKAFEVAPNYFAFVSDRMAAIHSKIDEDEEELSNFVSEVERTAFDFYEAIATPGAVAPEMPEFLYNEEVELDLDELIETEEDIVDEETELSTEEVLDALGEEGSSEKREQLISEIEDGEVPAGQGGEGDYAISKPVSSDEDSTVDSDLVDVVEDVSSTSDVEELSPVVEDVEEFSSDVEEVEEFSQPTDSIPDKKISVSIEKLRKKMSDDKDS
jgi:transcriptional antiterminator Rof (Rho-off)